MKTKKPARLSKRMRRILQEQVQEYVDRYYPHWGKVAVRINPSGTFASVRAAPKPRRQRAGAKQPARPPRESRCFFRVLPSDDT